MDTKSGQARRDNGRKATPKMPFRIPRLTNRRAVAGCEEEEEEEEEEETDSSVFHGHFSRVDLTGGRFKWERLQERNGGGRGAYYFSSITTGH